MTARQASIGALLAAAEASPATGWVLLAGAGFGAPRLLLDGVPVTSLQPGFSDVDAADLVAHLIPPKLDRQRAFLLGYEASAALLTDAPRHPHAVSLGPIAWVRDFRSWVQLEAGRLVFGGEGRELRAVKAQLAKVEDAAAPGAAFCPVLEVPDAAEVEHHQRVRRCQEHLRQGVLYQANLAHRLAVQRCSRGEALSWFAKTLQATPPAFAAVSDEPGWGLLLSLSPECLARWDLTQRTVEAFPVKGTRPRGATPAIDQALRDELASSLKDQAEHVMIVDLLRNDLGRVAEVGGVEVVELMRPLTAANVHHLESRIRARLAAGVGLPTVITALAPGGSITGAPKSTAVEVIHELEAGARGAYTGNLGVVHADGRGVASILIRTWMRPDHGPGALHVGGGIVVGSDAEAEWRETVDKAAAFGPLDAGYAD